MSWAALDALRMDTAPSSGAPYRANSELGVTVLAVTHDPEVSGMVRR